jgi:phage terminase large subunit-like protein
MYALGRYHEDFAGWRCEAVTKRLTGSHSAEIWVVGISAAVIRNTVQLTLVGDYGAGLQGTGLLPLECILQTVPSRGVAGGLDSIIVRRDDGTTCAIHFKSMEAGRQSAQGSAVTLIAVDELPDHLDYWMELLARLTATSGKIFLFATDLIQKSEVPDWFHEPNHPRRLVIQGSVYDAGHMGKAQIEAMIDKYKNNPAELRARVYGERYTGGGSVLYAPVDVVGCDRPISSFGQGICAISGIDPSHMGMSESASASACVHCVYHRDSDTLTVVEAFKQRQMLPDSFAARCLASPYWRDAVFAWGQAENQVAKDGKSYAVMYREYGMRMLGSHAALPGGGLDLDGQFESLQQGFSSGRLKINKHLHEMWLEIRALERDAHGKILSGRSDLLAALRYAWLCRKQARPMVPSEGGGVFSQTRRQAPWNSPEAIAKRTEFPLL